MIKKKNKIEEKIQGKKKKPSLTFLLSIIAFLTIIVTFLVLYIFFKPQQVVEYEMTLIVGDHIGIDTDNVTMTFGMVMPSGSSTRHFNIKNSEYRNKVKIKAIGNLAKLISVSDNNFILQPYEVKFIDISATIPTDAKFGNYTGTLKINFFRKTRKA